MERAIALIAISVELWSALALIWKSYISILPYYYVGNWTILTLPFSSTISAGPQAGVKSMSNYVIQIVSYFHPTQLHL